MSNNSVLAGIHNVDDLLARIAVLEAALGAMVGKRPMNYGEHEGDNYCAYCGEIIVNDIGDAPDCPWVKAKEVLVS